jgi:serine/threonine-protein kinase
MSAADSMTQAEARLGTILREKWRLDRVLGVGGFGAVYAATHRAGKRVAVKMLHPQLSQDHEIRKRFLREAYAANAVEHPGAVSVLDDDVTEDGAAFLVMDLLEGETLQARRKRKGGALPAGEVLSVVDQVPRPDGLRSSLSRSNLAASVLRSRTVTAQTSRSSNSRVIAWWLPSFRPSFR